MVLFFLLILYFCVQIDIDVFGVLVSSAPRSKGATHGGTLLGQAVNVWV